MSKESLIRDFANGETRGMVGNNNLVQMYIEDTKLYSYGDHYVLAHRLSFDTKMNSGYGFIINSTKYSNATATQQSKARQILGDYIELPDADYSEKGLFKYMGEINGEISTLESKFNKFKNPQGGRAIQTQGDITYKKRYLGTIKSFCDSLYGSNTERYIKFINKKVA